MKKVKPFNYLGFLLTIQNSIQGEIKCRLKAGNSRYYLVQTPKNLKINVHKNNNIVLYGCEARSLILREECNLRVLENRILRRIFSPRGMRMGSEEGSSI
jgi:hypothetical protein